MLGENHYRRVPFLVVSQASLRLDPEKKDLESSPCTRGSKTREKVIVDLELLMSSGNNANGGKSPDCCREMLPKAVLALCRLWGQATATASSITITGPGSGIVTGSFSTLFEKYAMPERFSVCLLPCVAAQDSLRIFPKGAVLGL